jgi:hypothetical protein
MYSPSLTMRMESSVSIWGGGFGATYNDRGLWDNDASNVPSVALGFAARTAVGIIIRAAFQYRFEGSVDFGEVEPAGADVSDIGDHGSVFDYSMYGVSASLLKPVRTPLESVDIYYGGGVALSSLSISSLSDRLSAASGYPVVGVSIYVLRGFELFAEFQYHVGRTKKSSFFISEQSNNVRVSGGSEWSYSMDGPSVWIGVNFW